MFGFLKQPTTITMLGLWLLYGLAVYFRVESLETEIWRIAAIGAGLMIPHLGLRLFKIKATIQNLLITLAILLLLADQEGSLFLLLLLGVMVTLLKTVVRLYHQPVVNPAAAGLFAMTFLGLPSTWWGVSFSPRLSFYGISVAMLITLPLGLWIIYKYKKWPTLIAVPLVFGVSYFLLKGTVPMRILLEGTFAFFLLIMATEPKTTPLIDWQEWVYGGLLGLLLAILFTSGTSNAYLRALLSLNVLFAGYKWLQLRMASRSS